MLSPCKFELHAQANKHSGYIRSCVHYTLAMQQPAKASKTGKLCLGQQVRAIWKKMGQICIRCHILTTFKLSEPQAAAKGKLDTSNVRIHRCNCKLHMQHGQPSLKW